MRTVLLIGNDINNATGNYSWDELIDGLINKANLSKIPNKKDKPFPLLYEEIYLNAARQNGFKEQSIKKFIASNTKNLDPNEIHERICRLSIGNILTTNYDLTFERTLGIEAKNVVNKGFIKESLYNLFRFHEANSTKIWHIHGSETTPKSITLGYEHYSGYLQQMFKVEWIKILYSFPLLVESRVSECCYTIVPEV